MLAVRMRWGGSDGAREFTQMIGCPWSGVPPMAEPGLRTGQPMRWRLVRVGERSRRVLGSPGGSG